MKTIGLLIGMERSFPEALIERINRKKVRGINAELVKVGAVKLNDISEYAVIFDRVSHEIPFFRTYLKLASLSGTKVVNNTFLSCTGDNFFHEVLATKLGIKVPKTVILPSKEHPPGTNGECMKNIVYPIDWDSVFDYVGFPAYIKPNKSNSSNNSYKVYNPREFFAAYDLTGTEVMVFQESIEFDSFYRTYTIGKKNVRIMNFDPYKPFHLRFSRQPLSISNDLQSEIISISSKICDAFGFDFNAIEFAFRDGVPYVIEFLNTSPTAEKQYVHDDNFEWLIETTANYLLELAKMPLIKYKEFNCKAFLLNNDFNHKTQNKRKNLTK